MADLKPAYLVHGDDDAKLDSWRRRLRARAGDEGASTSLEVLAGDALTADAFAEATGALTLSVGRRFVLADGIDRWKEKDVKQAAEALLSLPADTVVLMIAPGKVVRRRGKPTQGPASEALAKAVTAIGGEVQLCEAPTPSKYAAWTVKQGAELGLAVSDDAAQALIERVGTDENRNVRQRRLVRELEKLAVYGPEEGRVDRETVEAVTMSDVEARVYELAEAVIEGNRERAVLLAEDLRDRGVDIMHVVFAMLRQLHQARHVAAMLEAGASRSDIASALRVPQFVANQIAARAGRADAARLEHALDELAEIDFAVRGGAKVDAGTALTLALAR